ncbi:MAG: hypothetical protein [Namikivirus ohi]|uniref:Uncharacterized protein n=1 Tax=Bacteriophage sp. TaxID=38018 RepID=A0ABY5T2E8_9VIRU|nr:MAG: hypothetical protein [Bacteriophage sp.]
MNLNIEQFTTEITDTLAATGENYTVRTTDLDDYETSYEITKHGSTRKLYITPVEDDMTDMILYNEKGTTLATCTLFNKNDLNITTKELTNLITLCF